jgi:hypothetical protein
MLIKDGADVEWETKPHVDLREYIPQLKVGQYVCIRLTEKIPPKKAGGYPKKNYSVSIDDGE